MMMMMMMMIIMFDKDLYDDNCLIFDDADADIV